MRKALFAAIMSVGIAAAQARPAEACGVKLTVKAPKVKRASKSSNPSTILLLGEKDSRLVRDLRSKGHTVEHARTVSEADRRDYQVVVADASRVGEAQSTYDGAIVVPRKSKSSSSVKDVERRLARTTRGDSSDRVIRTATPTRRILRAGPEEEERRDVESRGGSDEPEPAVEARTPRPASRPAEAPAARQPARAEAERAEPAAEEEPRAKAPVKQPRVAAIETEPKRARKVETPRESEPAVRASWHREAYFATNSNRLNGKSRRQMRQNAEWLLQNPDATIVIEGHTDTVGDADYNAVLAERRAESARDFLVGLGVDASRIEVVSKGEDEPAYSPGTSAKNRRVVLIKQ